MMMGFVVNGLRWAGLWAALLAGSMAGVAIAGMGSEGVGTDGPFSSEAAFLIVNGLHAFVLTLVATAARVSRVRLFLGIFTVFYVVHSVLQHMEAFWFIDFLELSQEFLIRSSLMVLVQALIAGAVAALMWPNRSYAEEGKTPFGPFRFGGAVILYILCYGLAGMYIAWASTDVQAYYDFGDEIETGPLLLFQVLRGSLWAAIVVMLGRMIAGPVWARGVITGAVFAVLAAAQLIYPSSFMQWEVRQIHLVEVGTSNFAYGLLATLLLFAGVRRRAG